MDLRTATNYLRTATNFRCTGMARATRMAAASSSTAIELRCSGMIRATRLAAASSSNTVLAAKGCDETGVGVKMRKAIRYDVFLSFRGPDVRRGFVDHLYHALTTADIHVFLDAHELIKGGDIGRTLRCAIECSRIRIPIFSPDYASSVWCLKEISLIAGQLHGMTIPLFYKVLPSHVRHPDQCGSPYARAFQYHQSNGRHSGEEIEEWKAALFTVSNLSGWSLEDTNRYEATLVKRVVKNMVTLCKGKGSWAT